MPKKLTVKEAISEAEVIVSAVCQRTGVDISRACLQHAVVVNQLLGAPIVAGSASWKFTNTDTGTNPTHVSYEFEQALVETGMAQTGVVAFGYVLPEMHIWNAYQGRVLDMTSKYFPIMAETLQFVWDAPPPPAYHFGFSESPDRIWSYRRNELATQIVRELVKVIELDIEDYQLPSRKILL